MGWSAGGAGRLFLDVAVGTVEVHPNQPAHQPDEIVAIGQATQIVYVFADAQLLGRLERSAVGEGVQLGPRPLGLPKEDVHADIAHPLELLQ